MLKIHAVIFDWAGTVVDYGSRAPVEAFLALFSRHGVTAPEETARRFMGSHKRDHIRLMLEDAPVREAWLRQNHAEPELDALYEEFIPLQLDAIRRNAGVIPGISELMADLRGAGVKVGSTTGYVREMMSELEEAAAGQGFAPGAVVCADEVPAGRPSPWMALRAAMLLNAWPVSACVKVGDTVADIHEGLNGGMWTVGVTKTGNELGLAEAEVNALPPAELEKRLDAARHKLLGAGAHYVIDAAADLMPVLEDIEARLEVGARP